jgi:hypothetical protein
MWVDRIFLRAASFPPNLPVASSWIAVSWRHQGAGFMGEGRSQSSRSLTGVWQGIYSYPSPRLPTVAFTATLIEAGSLLSGSVSEPNLLYDPNATLLFSLSGSRNGTAVHFVKTYLGSGPHYRHPIVYDGAVNGDTTEIEGRWRIPGDWSGRFLMTRSGDPPQVAAESEGAEAGLEAVGPKAVQRAR